MSDSEAKSDSEKIEITEIVDSADDNSVAIEAISEKLTEVTGLAEELDQALQSAQQDCAISTVPTTTVATSMSTATGPIETASTNTDVNPTSTLEIPQTHCLSKSKTDDFKSDDEFITASDCTIHHSRSSSYNSVSECEHLYAPWWEHGKDDVREDVAKEKMVLAVGLPQLPPPESVLKPSPEVPPGKIAREVIETTHLKVQHQHTLGVSSFVLTSETVRDKTCENLGSEDLVRIVDTKEKEIIIPTHLGKAIDEDEFTKKVKEVGGKFEEEAWKNYNLINKQAVKSCL